MQVCFDRGKVGCRQLAFSNIVARTVFAFNEPFRDKALYCFSQGDPCYIEHFAQFSFRGKSLSFYQLSSLDIDFQFMGNLQIFGKCVFLWSHDRI